MNARVTSCDVSSPKPDEPELSSPSLSTSPKWRDPDTESKSGLRGWNATDPIVSAMAIFILAIRKVIIPIPSCA
jgi:hypothetical protein